MKNSSVESMWSLIWLVSLLGMLGLLLSVSVFAADITIDIDPSYAVQHIDSVRIMQEGNTGDDAIIKSEGAGLLKIQTNSNILLGIDNEIVGNGTNSTILGGINNTITGGQDSTIIAGASNSIDNSEGGESNTILGGQANKIGGASSFSTIAGGLRNSIIGKLSTIVGGKDNFIKGDFSAIVGEENVVMGDNSVAAGKNSTVNANNSFLWTDSTNNGELNADDVFAVVSRRGMVINALAPNQYAQLTIGGPLVVSMNDNDENVICSGGQGGGTMKTLFTGGRYCLCSCDGNSRNSMFGQGQCQAICHGEAIHPACGTKVERIHCDDVYTFRGSCEGGYPVDGTGAYLVDKNDVIHWTCQTSDGAFTGCSLPATEMTEIPNCPANCNTPWGETIPDGGFVVAYSPNSPIGTCDGIVRRCNAGDLDGDEEYKLPTCVTNGCKKPWNNEYIPDGSGLKAYEQNVVPYGSSCVAHERKCINGSLTEEGIYEDCIVHDETNCIHNGLEYPHGKIIVTYEQVSYQCPDGCKEHSSEARCYNGKWLKTDPDYWVSDTELKPDVNPDTIRANLYYYPRCDSTNSFNATTYTLLMCPSQGTCSTGTVSLGGKNPNNRCSTNTMNKLEYCAVGYYNSGNVTCVQCPTGYSSKTGASLNGCFIKCGDAEYLPDEGGDSCKSCPVGTYITGHTVNYGNKSSCYPCDNGPAHSVYTTNGTGNNCGWKCADGFHKVGNECKGSCGTYNPSNFKVLDMYFITDSGTTGHYALMDRNLGATQVYAGIDNICTYGYYYQWGNNYGFANEGSIKTSTERVDTSSYGPDNYYSSDTFIKTSQDWSINQNDNLWGGYGNEIERRGPCPVDYHIPSSYEFRNIVDNYWKKSVYEIRGSEFALDFLMPVAGYRNSYSNVVGQTLTGAIWYSNRSNPTSGYSVHLWFHLNSSDIIVGHSSRRIIALPVRCARNSQAPALILHPDGGKKALIIVHDNKITKLGTPTKAGKTFLGWYWDEGYTSLAYTGQTVPASAHLYAKWN